jgi:peptidoglycan/LPS O-acetylase OafA/YrhL
MGKISFGVYLLHPLIIPSFGALMAGIVFDPARGVNIKLAETIVMAWTITLTTLISWLFFYIADKPSISFGLLAERLFIGDDFQFKSSKLGTMLRKVDSRLDEMDTID